MFDPWDRRPDETHKAYDAFKLFLGSEAVPGMRNLSDIGKTLGCSQSNISQWAKKHNWYSRAEDFERHLVKLREQRERQKVDEAVARWRERRLEEAERIYRTRNLIQEKIEQMSSYPIVETEDILDTDADGKTIGVTRVVPAKWQVKDIATMLNLSVAAMDRAYEIVVGQNQADRPFASDDKLSPEDGAAALEAIERRRKLIEAADGGNGHREGE
jgi:predicted transcriptional regulator